MNYREVRKTGRQVDWTTEEETKLKDAVEMHNGKNWDAVATLVADRTGQQCASRWHDVFDRTTPRSSYWTASENGKAEGCG
jgi:hypothetical protein